MSTHDVTHDGGSEQVTGQPREDAPAPRRTGWHAVNTGHLVMGVAFVGLVVVWVLFTIDAVDIPDDGWVMGLPWLVAGAVGLVATVLRGPRRHWSHDQWRHDHWGHGGGGNHGSGSMHGWH